VKHTASIFSPEKMKKEKRGKTELKNEYEKNNLGNAHMM
jgi:hypothetical protein